MKKVIILFAIIFYKTIFSQVIISPYILYTDAKNKFGTFLVQNESDEIYEVDISFIFGYPVSDSVGNATMQYYDQPDTLFPSATKWVRAFPRKFALNPKERQVVRMTINPPADVTPGTYWSRIVTSAAPQSIPFDTLSEGVRAQIKFVLNQITTLLYRVDPTTTGIEIENFYSDQDSINLNIYAKLRRTGNSPFFGNITALIRTSEYEVVAEEEQSLSIYFEMVKKFQFDLQKFTSGSYSIELKIVSDEKEVFSESTLEPIPQFSKYLTIEVP
ncbi:MAG: hypothetical protein MUF28_12115 [Ignavibacterium sp.]|nr:hypothetical protein [Ignavibacterium sp.]